MRCYKDQENTTSNSVYLKFFRAPDSTSYQVSPDAVKWNVPKFTTCGFMSKLKESYNNVKFIGLANLFEQPPMKEKCPTCNSDIKLKCKH